MHRQNSKHLKQAYLPTKYQGPTYSTIQDYFGKIQFNIHKNPRKLMFWNISSVIQFGKNNRNRLHGVYLW